MEDTYGGGENNQKRKEKKGNKCARGHKEVKDGEGEKDKEGREGKKEER